MSDYPYVATYRHWGHEFPFIVDSFRSFDWYFHPTTDGGRSEFLKDIIHPGDVVIDVGANVGLTTILFAHQVGPTGHVVAIEPSTENVQKIRDNVKVNNLKNVSVVQAILAQAEGLELHFENEIVQTGGQGAILRSVTLDSFAGYSPDVVKIDVEGYELPVLLGAKRLLERGVRLEVEIHLDHGHVHMTELFGFHPQEIEALLRSHHYRIFDHGREVLPGEPLTHRPHALPIICVPDRDR